MNRAILLMVAAAALATAADRAPVPRLDGEWWQVAGNPDLGRYTSPKQQPVDFAIWQAEDGTWQLWSCIRLTNCGGRTRLFYRWQADRLTDTDWTPMGIAMQADTGFGETQGGLQAPFVLKIGSEYQLFYGDWENICAAKSFDGKTFARQLRPDGRSAIFTEGHDNNTRDMMVIHAATRYIGYYTAFPDKKGAVYARTSKNLRDWGPSKIVAFGGAAGDGPFSAECPFVYYHAGSKLYYLFRTQLYGLDAQTTVYASPDPLSSGVNDDRYLVTRLPVAVPEIIEDQGELYLAALLPSLKGIAITRLKFEPPE